MTYVFLLDASACSGCKACQVACKDKNRLPLGVLWRRVYEVTGGSWQQEGAAWTNTLFAYNLSLSCNHCVHPKCAGVCPVDAYTVREDGIVLLDSSKCIGCGYCAWACPYEAPQYDPAAGHMTKCNFCYDNLDLGLPPACVAACPLRVLGYAEIDSEHALPEGRIALWDVPAQAHPYPMAQNSRTEPHLAIKPHAGMGSAEAKSVVNREEIQPQKRTGWEEAPLVAFTLLMQMAVGSLWAMPWLFHEPQSQWLPMLLIGLCLGAGLMASFAHLGTRRNAWRALNHLRKSWLSREILFSLLFGAGWLAAFAGTILHADVSILRWLTALIGLVLVYCMSRVYRLPAVPAWNTPWTNVRFFHSAALLGILGVVAVSAWTHIAAPQQAQAYLLVTFLLITQAMIENGQPLPSRGTRLQWILMLAALIGCAVFLLPGWFNPYTVIALLLVVLAEQAVSRWSFYQARETI